MQVSNLHYEGRYFSLGEHRDVHVMEFGSGPPVMLIHGAGGGGPMWHRQIAALSENHRVIVPDVPMFGLSTIPDEVRHPREQIADLILSLMDELDIEQTDIAGHSLGGLSTLGAMIREPTRFRRAFLAAPPGFGKGLHFVMRIAWLPVIKRFINLRSRKSRYIFFDQYEAQKSGPSPERERFKELHYQVGNRHGGDAAFRNGLRTFTGVFGQRDILERADVSRITAEIMMVWGDSDLIIPTKQHLRALELMPGLKLEIFENCGHVLQLEAPEKLTARIVAWFNPS